MYDKVKSYYALFWMTGAMCGVHIGFTSMDRSYQTIKS